MQQRNQSIRGLVRFRAENNLELLLLNKSNYLTVKIFHPPWSTCCRKIKMQTSLVSRFQGSNTVKLNQALELRFKNRASQLQAKSLLLTSGNQQLMTVFRKSLIFAKSLANTN